MNQEHIVKSFDRDLTDLDRKIAVLGKTCERQLSKAVDALTSLDPDLAEDIVAKDESVNRMQNDIEDYSVFLIAKRQPVARDLRHAVSGFKISSEFERIGDYAANIAKRILILDKISLTEPVEAVIQMLNIANHMISDVIRALMTMDVNLAASVWATDDDIDHIYSAMMTGLKLVMEDDPARVEEATLLIHMGRCCERIGDHLTNIAETIYYIDSGESYIGNLD